ncbi:hypothetical protein GXW82_44205 [Streptacidiphilus sp. 4-A2]|nr:hypothetical protein [Streptacidiphilus sp. 4-A2]
MVAIQNSTGELFAYPFDSSGNLGAGVEIGTGWGGMQLVGGTFHGKPGIVVGIDAVTIGGLLELVTSNGASTLSTSTLAAPQTLSSGWSQETSLTAVNGITADNGTDIAAADPLTGISYLYHQADNFIPTGRTDLGMDVYTPPAGVDQDLFHQSDGSWLLRDQDGTTYTFGGAGAPAGKLSQITDKQGRTQVLNYTNGQLSTVTDTTSGRTLHVTWNGAGTTSRRSPPTPSPPPAQTR